jgi:hypothetical protein
VTLSADTPGPDHRANPDKVGTLAGAPSSVLNRYAAAFLQLALAVVGAFVLFPDGVFADPSTGVPAGLSLLAVALGAVLTYWVPLVGARQSSVLKVVVPVGLTVIGSLIQFTTAGNFSSTAIALLALALLQGISSKLGVDIRKDALALAA